MQKAREPMDTHLLRILQILLTEQSVSRAAIKLGLSQPALSNSLRRLREITGDPILVRSKTGMVPTERGMELLDQALGKAGKYQDQAMVRGKELARTADVYVKDNPWRTVAVAAGVGLLLGVILGRK